MSSWKEDKILASFNLKRETWKENKTGVTIDKDTIEGLKETVRNLYLADDIPWVIGYSGGKDSTATVQLVWLALEELPKVQVKKTVHIINTDTLVESPVISKWVKESLEKWIRKPAKKGCLL